MFPWSIANLASELDWPLPWNGGRAAARVRRPCALGSLRLGIEGPRPLVADRARASRRSALVPRRGRSRPLSARPVRLGRGARGRADRAPLGARQSAQPCFAAPGRIGRQRRPHPLHADGGHDARGRSPAELDAPGASQALGCCKHDSSSRAAGVALPLPDKGSHVPAAMAGASYAAEITRPPPDAGPATRRARTPDCLCRVAPAAPARGPHRQIRSLPPW